MVSRIVADLDNGVLLIHASLPKKLDSKDHMSYFHL